MLWPMAEDIDARRQRQFPVEKADAPAHAVFESFPRGAVGLIPGGT